MQISTGFASWQRHYTTVSSSGRQLNFAALNTGRHLCSAGRPSRWALAHVLVVVVVVVVVVVAVVVVVFVVVVTFHVRRSRGEMYIGHCRLCACLSVCLSLAAFPHYCTDPGVRWENDRGCPLVVHYSADLHAVHRFLCYDNIVPNAKCQRMLVFAVCLVVVVTIDM